MTDRLYISACALALAEIIIDCTHVLLTEGRDKDAMARAIGNKERMLDIVNNMIGGEADGQRP